MDAGSKLFTSIREDEILRGITMKSSGVSLYYDHEYNNKK